MRRSSGTLSYAVTARTPRISPAKSPVSELCFDRPLTGVQQGKLAITRMGVPNRFQRGQDRRFLRAVGGAYPRDEGPRGQGRIKHHRCSAHQLCFCRSLARTSSV